jgi:hypothetical protein
MAMRLLLGASALLAAVQAVQLNEVQVRDTMGSWLQRCVSLWKSEITSWFFRPREKIPCFTVFHSWQ